MTATEWLFKELWECDKDKFTWHNIFEQAKEMEKQQMQDFGARCCLMTKQKNEWTLEQLYNETYGSKGSDETKGGELATFNTSSTTISDEEIKAFAMGYYDNNGADYYVDLGAKWYREQLKKKI